MRIKADVFPAKNKNGKHITIYLDSISPLNVTNSYVGEILTEGTVFQATTTSEIPNLTVEKYNMIIDGYGELKLVAWRKTPCNLGTIRKKYRYTLMLNG